MALIPLPQADGQSKPRPAILLRRLPPFGDWLACGVSTQLHQQVRDFDDVIDQSHSDFADSGLKATSLIRLGFLAVLPADQFIGVLGSISEERHRRLLRNLSAFLISEEGN